MTKQIDYRLLIWTDDTRGTRKQLKDVKIHIEEETCLHTDTGDPTGGGFLNLSSW